MTLRDALLHSKETGCGVRSATRGTLSTDGRALGIKESTYYRRTYLLVDDILATDWVCSDGWVPDSENETEREGAEALAVTLIQAQPPWPEHEESVRIYGWDVQRDDVGVYLFPPGVEGTNDILEPHDAVRLGLALIRAAKETP